MTLPTFERAIVSSDPYPHARIPSILSKVDADHVLEWLKAKAPWALRVEDFYEQHEFSLQNSELDGIEFLMADKFVRYARSEMERCFGVQGALELVDVSAHRLTSGQTIRIHNDFIGDEETHRLLIQLNGDGMPNAVAYSCCSPTTRRKASDMS